MHINWRNLILNAVYFKIKILFLTGFISQFYSHELLLSYKKIAFTVEMSYFCQHAQICLLAVG